ncbi:PKHJ1 protein, partial [Oxylabes madagascariensis]|nr:PKHJ1 protein [Oxylabes madagascariensis]
VGWGCRLVPTSSWSTELLIVAWQSLGREAGGHQQLCQDLPGPFSLSLAGFIEEPERKYCFECATEEQCQEWVEALKRASYEFLRRSLIFYRNEIQKMTGKVSESLQGTSQVVTDGFG